MKKNLLLVPLFFFLSFFNVICAQPAFATWPLTAAITTGASVSGSVTAVAEAIGPYFPAPAYNTRTLSTGGSVSSQTVTVNPNGIGTSSASAHSNGGYVQFAVSPQTSAALSVGSIAMYLGSGNANSVSMAVEYSLSADFSSAVVLGTPGGATSFPTTNVLYPFSFTPSGVTILSGQTLYLRIYAWHGSTAVRYLLVSNLVISGSTATSAPAVATTAVSNISSTSATTGGNVTNDAGNTVTERGVVYSTAANPTTADTKIADASGGTGPFTSALTGLTPFTDYHVRSYAISSAGTGYGNDVPFTTTAPDALSVTALDNGSTVVLSNGLVSATIVKATATVTSLVYNGLELVSGGYNGGQLYWSWNMPNYQNPANCTYTLTADPRNNNFTFAEIKLHMAWDGTASTAAMNVDIYFSLPRNTPGIYAAATLSHPASYPANPGGEWRMAGYPAPLFDWLSVDSLRNRKMATAADGANAITVAGAPAEVSRFTTGIYNNQYECKYDYSADFGEVDAWGWSSTANNVGLWMTAPGKEYYPGGPMKRELMCHLTPVILNMLGGTHYGGGDSTAVAAGETWEKTYGPFLIYCNKVPAGTANAPMALWADAVARAKTEQAKWPYTWFTNPGYVQQAGRGTVTGTLAITDASASAANMWVGLAIPPPGSGTDFQHWSKGYQFWVKTDAAGNFTIPNVLPGTYNLYAFGPGAAGQLSLASYATVTAGNTSPLGTVYWTPARTANTVWEIGVPDRTAKEFKHGKDWWTSNTYPSLHWGKFMDYPDEFPADVNFTIGQSDIKTDWNFVQYYDNSVQSTSPNWKVSFNLATEPTTSSTAAVYVAFAAAFNTALIVNVNGTNVTSPATGVIPANKTNATIRKGIHGAFSDHRFTFPASLLHAGANQISFTVRLTGGASSGDVMYDYVRLEAAGTSVVSSLLPVTLSSVKAWQKTPGIQVEWTAQTELNMDRYEVEKGGDGRTFIKASMLRARGATSEVTYEWFDAAPFSGANYYRIKAVGNDGQVQYSKIVKVNPADVKTAMTVYPAPVTGNSFVLQLNNFLKGIYHLTLTNGAGQQVWTRIFEHRGGAVAQTIVLPDGLASGIYRLSLTGNEMQLVSQFIKN